MEVLIGEFVDLALASPDGKYIMAVIHLLCATRQDGLIDELWATEKISRLSLHSEDESLKKLIDPITQTDPMKSGGARLYRQIN